MSEILFSTTAFLQILGLDPEVAFWTTAGVVAAVSLILLVGAAINLGTSEPEGEDECTSTTRD